MLFNVFIAHTRGIQPYLNFCLICASSKEKACLSLAPCITCLSAKRGVQLCNVRRNNSSAVHRERLQFHEGFEPALFWGQEPHLLGWLLYLSPTCWWSCTENPIRHLIWLSARALCWSCSVWAACRLLGWLCTAMQRNVTAPSNGGLRWFLSTAVLTYYTFKVFM